MIKFLKGLIKYFLPKYQTIFLEYKVEPLPRYGHGLPANKNLLKAINANRSIYIEILSYFIKFKSKIQEIKNSSLEVDENLPTWNNGFLPGLDIIGIYGMIARFKPQQYIEIGSGNSTKVARKCINEQMTNTKILSIDPFPRANIDHLADKVIRQPLEKISNVEFIAESLNENDILFIDNSHRVLPNSDAMVCFLELLSNLKSGVIVHFHDIYLPFDYPQFMCDRFYSEQYLLAAFILANPKKYSTILPNYFISEDPDLANIVLPFWDHSNLKNVERHGGSFWIRIEE
ncbi:MAG: class I SAM-dependent methyltransferase [Saprospiraceae bacterium]|nr:class I SAM-dependent methyltransferase [Saprospiraceae bacterium]